MVNGVINQLWTKEVTTKYGEKPVTLFTVEGNEDNVFNLGFGKQQVAEGDEVSFNHQDLKYGEYPVDKNTLKIVSRGNKVEAPAPVPKNTGSKGYSRGNFPLDFTDGQRSILRQHAFTQASEIYRTYRYNSEGVPLEFEDLQKTVHDITELARGIELYTSGDELRDEMKESE